MLKKPSVSKHFQTKMVLAFELWARSLQFLSNASANLLVFVAKCLGVSWDRLGLAWVSLGPFWDSLGSPWDQIHGSDPWIWFMVLFDLKCKIDFLMSFRDFAELSFFSRASGDNCLRSVFFIFGDVCWTYASPTLHTCREKVITAWREKIDDWWVLSIDHWSLMIDD